jgi:hypothetical protein
MSRPPDRLFEQASDVIRSVSAEALQAAETQLRRRRRGIARFLKAALMAVIAAIVIPIGMCSGGLLLGEWWQGLVAAPIALFIAWTAIAVWAFRRPRALPPPRMAAGSGADLALLPVRTEAWLEHERRALPSGAQRHLDSISQHLQAMTPQLKALDPQMPVAHEVRRLLGEELPELVRVYHKVPRALRRQPLNGGISPDRQVVEGLATVNDAITRLHEDLASADLRALATQQRYLDLKYKRDGNLE